MNSPHKSFIIWFSPRTGSTLLCKALEDTGACGKAGEFLNDQGDDTLQAFYEAEDFTQLRQSLWEKGMSNNGVFGTKYSCYFQHHQRVFTELQNLQDQALSSELDWQNFESLFPNCKHIYLTRRNKVRVAISWWKAIQDQQWHRLLDQVAPQDEQFYKKSYNVDALQHLLKEHCLRESYTEEFFSYNDISPLTVVYEDFIRDYERTLYRILDYLEIDRSEVQLHPPFYQKTADANTEAWAQRFRSDIQEGWDKRIW